MLGGRAHLEVSAHGVATSEYERDSTLPYLPISYLALLLHTQLSPIEVERRKRGGSMALFRGNILEALTLALGLLPLHPLALPVLIAAMPFLSKTRARAGTQNNVSSQCNITPVPLGSSLIPIAEAPLSKFACATANKSDRFPDPGNQHKSAWEYYLDLTDIMDDDREREWQDLLDVILVFVRPPRIT